MATRVSSLTESGILAGITVVMAIVAMYVPLLGILAVLLWPLPMILLLVRHGIKWALMSVATAIVVTAALVEPMASLRLAVSFAPTGLALGIGYRNRWSGVKIFSVATFASIIAKGLGLYIVFLLTGIEPFAGQLELMPQQFEQSVAMYQSMGMSPEQIEEARRNFSENLKMIALLLPMVVLIMGILDTALNFWAGGILLRRFGEPVPVFPKFTEWRLSSFFAYLYAFSILGMYWGNAHDIPLLYKIAVNMNMAGTVAGLVQGVSVFQAAAAHYRWKSFMANILLILLVLSGIGTQVIVFTGLFDTVFDYRRRLGWQK